MKTKNLGDIVNDNMREYAKAVVSERAIPSIVDGLKPTARRALYTSYKFYGGSRTKVNELAGRAVKFVPTGDAGTIGTLGNMAREWPGANNFRLLKPTGAVGSRVFDDQGAIAAARYLSVSISQFSKDFLFNDSEIWQLVLNYDESDHEVKHFFPILPVCLINGIEGIAYGVSTKIYPRSPKDLSRVVISILEGKDRIKIPDPWFKDFKGQVIKHPDEEKWFTLGAVEKENNTTWKVIDLPIGMSREKFIKRLENHKRLGKIQSYTDECTSEIGFTIRVKRDMWNDEMDVLTNLIGSANLNEQLYVLDEEKNLMFFPDVVELLREFVKIKMKHMDRLRTYHMANEKINAEAIEAKIIAIENNLLENKFKTRKDMLRYIIKDLGISETWAHDVLQMRVYHFTAEHLKKLKEQLKVHKELYKSWKQNGQMSLLVDKVAAFRDLIDATKRKAL